LHHLSLATNLNIRNKTSSPISDLKSLTSDHAKSPDFELPPILFNE